MRPGLSSCSTGSGASSARVSGGVAPVFQITPVAVASAAAPMIPETAPARMRLAPDNGPPASHAGRRSIMSPTTPPSPVGSGQCAKVGRQDTKAAVPKTPTSHRTNRRTSRSSARCVTRRQPQIATGRMSATVATPSSCIMRSAATAPETPSRLRTGALVAWLRLGSCTDQVASAMAARTDTAISTKPAASYRRRRAAARNSSGRSERSNVRRIACMLLACCYGLSTATRRCSASAVVSLSCTMATRIYPAPGLPSRSRAR